MADTQFPKNIRLSMDSLYRHFVVNEKILDSYEKYFRHIETDIKLLRFASGSMGTTSDAFILFAIAVMGCASKESITNFLYGYKRLHPNLQIYEPTDSEGLRRRLISFASNGIVFRHNYTVDVVSEKSGKATQENTLLYTLEDSMLNFINNKLDTRVRLQKWIAAKPLEELIGWAACSYCASSLCYRPELIDFKQGTFSSKACGSVIMPMEVKLNNGTNDTYVAHIPAFLHFNKSRQTETMFEDACVEKILTIRDYLEFRGAKSQDPYVAIVCESSTDAEKMRDLIIRTGALLDYTQRLYFTSEGLFRSDADASQKYFQMDSADNNYAFVQANPSFLKL